MKKIIPIFLIWTNLLEILLYSFNKKILDQDMAQWKKYAPYRKAGVLTLNYLLLFYKPFRAVFIYRTISKNRALYIFKPFVKRPPVGIEIYGRIEGGLVISHNMGSIINVTRAGKNLTVAQGVTIGAGKANAEGRNTPIIGDNVKIHTNAVVFGGIEIGNNVSIGAGTVLFKSIPDNSTVVGNPARIINPTNI